MFLFLFFYLDFVSYVSSDLLINLSVLLHVMESYKLKIRNYKSLFEKKLERSNKLYHQNKL